VAILLIAVVANGAVSVGLYNQVQGYQVATQIDAFESQIEDLILQLNELQTGLVFLNESMIEEIQYIRANLTELQQTLTDLVLIDLVDIATQLAELQARLDEISASTGLRDFSMMDYNLTGTFTNWVISPIYVVNGTQDDIYLKWTHDVTTPVVKGLWKWFLHPLDTPDNDIDPSVIQGNYTIVILIWSPFRNISTSWNAVDALVVLDDWYDPDGWHNVNDTMSVQGVGDVIEITYSYELNITPPNRGGPFTLFRLNEDFPEGEYRIMMALKEVS
jgi:uncharacterized membrane protein